VIAFLLALLLFSPSSFPADDHAKARMKNAENLMKEGKPVEAYEEANLAVTIEPSNKKYHEKLAEIGQAASRVVEAQAREKLKTDPQSVRALLQDALRYDPSNIGATQALRTFDAQLIDVSGKAQQARRFLDEGKLAEAQTLLDSIAPYRMLVPAIDVLQQSAASERHVDAAEAMWNGGNPDATLRELKTAESVSIEPQYVSTKSDALRKKLSDYYLEQVSSKPALTPRDLLNQAYSVNRAIEIYPANPQASKMKDNVTRAIETLLPDSSLASRTTPSAARVSLAQVSLLQEETKDDPKLALQKSSLTSLAYPLLHMKVIVNTPNGCDSKLDKGFITDALSKALHPLVELNDQKWDVSITLRDTSCSQTDVPRQSERMLNSTFVAGKNQIANPEYAQLLTQSQELQAQVAQLQAQNQSNPNFGTGFALGLAQGKLRRVQNALASTPPYLYQDIAQQYQYAKFASYRSYEINSNVLFSSSNTSRHTLDEERIRVLRESQAEGVSGVLAEDHSGLHNSSPNLVQVSELESQAETEFAQKCVATIKEVMTKYLTLEAKGREETSNVEGLGYFLYAAEMAQGTASQAGFEPGLVAANASLLDGKAQIQSFRVPTTLPTLEEVEVSDTHIEDGGTQPNIESFIEGVVSIETDSGAGSGFFITPGCLVVTNNHVVEGAETIVVKNSVKKLFVGQVLARDPRRDLALLTLGAHGCHYLKIGDQTQTRIGQEVYAIGNPIGLSNTVTRGIISAYRSTKDGVNYVQLDATINPGNSGGPLLTRTGLTIGINTFKVRGYEGLNFAIAASEIIKAFRPYIQ
jgi:S1-C subfamily serine protease